MPELPEEETVRKRLLKRLKNRKIKSINILYDNIFEGQREYVEKNIRNQTINDIQRRGKWLIFCLDDYYLLSHLRMEGKYLYRNIGDEVQKHELVIFNIDDEFELRYKDVRKFGKMQLIPKSELKTCVLSKLGFEPWDDKLTEDYLLKKFKLKSISIKTALLDQSIIAGIGNIYANEILFLSGISPYRKCKDLTFSECTFIISNTRSVLFDAINGGGTTIRSYTSEEGVSGNFQNNLYVHGRDGESCKNCGGVIVREKINGRSAYYCKRCQK